MTAITPEEVEHVAVLARLRLSPEEVAHFTGHLGAILEHAADVEALDLADVPPTSHPVHLENVMRPDRVGPTLDREEVLAEAPAAQENRFRVPPILGVEP